METQQSADAREPPKQWALTCVKGRLQSAATDSYKHSQLAQPREEGSCTRRHFDVETLARFSKRICFPFQTRTALYAWGDARCCLATTRLRPLLSKQLSYRQLFLLPSIAQILLSFLHACKMHSRLSRYAPSGTTCSTGCFFGQCPQSAYSHYCAPCPLFGLPCIVAEASSGPGTRASAQGAANQSFAGLTNLKLHSAAIRSEHCSLKGAAGRGFHFHEATFSALGGLAVVIIVAAAASVFRLLC